MHGLKRPMFGGRGGRDFARRIPRAAVDPALQQCDLLGCERLALGRHAFGFVGGENALEKMALGAFPRHDRGIVFAAFVNQRARVQPQLALLFQPAVTGVTALLENRLDVAFVIRRSRPHRGLNGDEAHGQPERERTDEAGAEWRAGGAQAGNHRAS